MGFDQHPGHTIIRRLHDGETVELENSGIFVKEIPGELLPGDDYVGARNTINLLTVDHVERGWVVSREPAYAFDLDECVKVELVDC